MSRRDRFVRPKVVRVEISDGDWIEIKKELTVGERKRMFAAGLKQMQTGPNKDPKFDIDPVEMSFAKVKEYLVDWSFVEPLKEDEPEGDVSPVELTEASIRNLDEATFEEIEDAIDAHIEKQEKEKKATIGAKKPG